MRTELASPAGVSTGGPQPRRSVRSPLELRAYRRRPHDAQEGTSATHRYIREPSVLVGCNSRRDKHDGVRLEALEAVHRLDGDTVLPVADEPDPIDFPIEKALLFVPTCRQDDYLVGL